MNSRLVRRLHHGHRTSVLIRPVERTDGPALVEAFARLSLQSRRSRFLTAKAELTTAEVRYFTDLDHHDHEALVAITPVDGRAVGVARFVRDAADRRGADVAVTVVDEWHRRGVARALITALAARAEQENVAYFTAHVAEDNVAMICLLQAADVEVDLVDHGSGVLVYRVANTGKGTAGRAHPKMGDGSRYMGRRSPCAVGFGSLASSSTTTGHLPKE